MKLVYINKIGQNWKGNYIYEFLFSDVVKDIDGEGWDSYPSSGNPEPPEGRFVKETGLLNTTLKLDLVQESDSFAMWDAVDGIVAMSWENMEGYDEYPEKRLFFSFGEDIESVNSKLYEKDIVLNYNKELINT
ncbi:hypothetical protein HOK09_04985 [Candidatus Woesearchaeota archaeon]|nr:hypothetical protein [Candidatus Woesearchaeota archaeon]